MDIENTGSENIAINGSMFKFYADGYALSNIWLNEENELPLSSNLSPGRKVKGRAYAVLLSYVNGKIEELDTNR